MTPYSATRVPPIAFSWSTRAAGNINTSMPSELASLATITVLASVGANPWASTLQVTAVLPGTVSVKAAIGIGGGR